MRGRGRESGLTVDKERGSGAQLKGNVVDLSPLKGMPLTSLDVYGMCTQVSDLSPLKGMPLTR